MRVQQPLFNELVGTHDTDEDEDEDESVLELEIEVDVRDTDVIVVDEGSNGCRALVRPPITDPKGPVLDEVEAKVEAKAEAEDEDEELLPLQCG